MLKSQGFTLIEIVVVILVISLFVAFTIPQFNTATSDKKLEQQVKQLTDVLELARSKTSASDLSSSTCTSLGGYRVLFPPSAPPIQYKTYRLRVCCNSACTTSYDIPTVYTLPSDLSMSISGMPTDSSSNYYIHFRPIILGTTLAGDAVIKVMNLTKCIPVTVNPSSIVTEGSKQGLPC